MPAPLSSSWFNQTPSAPIAPARKTWFASTRFRRAMALAINREGICRVVYHGNA